MRFTERLHRRRLTKKTERAEQAPARASSTREACSCVRLHNPDPDFAKWQPLTRRQLVPGDGLEPRGRMASVLGEEAPGECTQYPPSVPCSPVVLRGMLKYLDSRQRWKRREVRCDGRMLVCLRSERVAAPCMSMPVNYVGRLPPLEIRALRAAPPCTRTDPVWNRGCLLGNPSSLPGGSPTAGRRQPGFPPINHPLFATPNEDVVLSDGSFAVQYFQDARWILPLAEITGITALAQLGGERLDGSFAIHAGRTMYALQAADDAEAALWIRLLTAPIEAISAALTPPQHSRHRRNAVRTGKKSVSWNAALKSIINRSNLPVGNSTSLNCAECSLRKRLRGNARRPRPPRRESLLHGIFENFNNERPEVPDDHKWGNVTRQCLGHRSDPVPPGNTLRSGRPQATVTPPRPVPTQHRSQSRIMNSPPVVMAEEEFLPLASAPLPVPSLRMRSSLSHSPLRAIKCAKIESPVPHEATLQFAPSAAPTQAQVFDLDAPSITSEIDKVRRHAAASSSGRDAAASTLRELVPNEVRKQILSRAMYLLREIRCASGFIPIPAGRPESEPSSTGRPTRRRPHFLNTPAVKVSRLPVVIALEHLEDVIDGFLFCDLRPSVCTPEEAEEEEPQFLAAKDAVRRIVADIMRRAHVDVMKLVGEGGKLAANSDFEAAIASVELLVVLISPEGLQAIY